VKATGAAGLAGATGNAGRRVFPYRPSVV